MKRISAIITWVFLIQGIYLNGQTTMEPADLQDHLVSLQHKLLSSSESYNYVFQDPFLWAITPSIFNYDPINRKIVFGIDRPGPTGSDTQEIYIIVQNCQVDYVTVQDGYLGQKEFILTTEQAEVPSNSIFEAFKEMIGIPGPEGRLMADAHILGIKKWNDPILVEIILKDDISKDVFISVVAKDPSILTEIREETTKLVFQPILSLFRILGDSYQGYISFVNFKISPPGPSNENVLIGFILDSSGSMRTSDPNDIRKAAVKRIFSLLKGDEKVFIVDFDGSAYWLNPNEWQNWSLENLAYYVDRINSDGLTNLGAGLEKMREAIEDKIDYQTIGNILMFTDGKGAYQNEALWFGEHQIPVNTISYTRNGDAITMSRIASETGGIYLLANNEEDVISALNDFFNNISGYNKIITKRTIIQKGQEINYSFYLDHQTNECLFSTSWLHSKVGMSLTAPDGNVYNENSYPYWVIGDNYISLKLMNPMGGMWNVKLMGIDIPQGGEPVVFDVSGDTRDKFRLESEINPGGFAVMRLVKVEGSADISGIIPSIYLTTPTARQIDISDQFSSSIFRITPIEGMGNYDVIISFQAVDGAGFPIQREFKRSVLFGENVPSFRSYVRHIEGNYIFTDLGSWTGNQAGLKCYIYSGQNSVMSAKATGIVKYVTEKECQIEITEFLSGASSLSRDDVVELDIQLWQGDINPR